MEQLAAMRAASEALLSDAFGSLDGPALIEFLHCWEAHRRQEAAIDQVLLARVEDSRVAGEWGRASTVDLLVTGLRVSPPEARARTLAATDMGPRRALTGEPLPPLHPVVAAAQAAGEISSEHARVVTRCIEHIPVEAGPEAPSIAEAMLVEAARHQDPKASRVDRAGVAAAAGPRRPPTAGGRGGATAGVHDRWRTRRHLDRER